jgi:hypothetical protein
MILVAITRKKLWLFQSFEVFKILMKELPDGVRKVLKPGRLIGKAMTGSLKILFIFNIIN